ncbi:MAG: hypothetical protein MUE96_04945 [Bacteroidia bacterium]|jgi:uncharacterized protein (TIGR02145 family)|nr:hypothetical protein [Bacteroidia bacterium]
MKNTTLFTVCLLIFCQLANAQNDTMYIMKNGNVIQKIAIKPSDLDSIIFYKPTSTNNPETVTDFDGNVYNTVIIGTQVWMKENLKTTHYANGTPIPLVSGNSNWDALTTTSKAYCWYNDNINNKEPYGALYTWAAAMNGANSSSTNPSGIQGACPNGWHLPSDAEWLQLITFLGGEAFAGNKLKETGTAHWPSPNDKATNESGFTALPSGYRFNYGAFLDIGNYSYWWSSTTFGSMDAWVRNVAYFSEEARRYGESKESGFSIRCIKN